MIGRPYLVGAAVFAATSVLPQVVSRLTVNGVRVGVQATENGAPVRGLTAADFEVLDNGVAQRVDSVEDARHLTVGLALDTSPSVSPSRETLLNACSKVVHSLEAGDQTALLTFADRLSLVVPLTKDLATVQDAIVGPGAPIPGSVPRSTVWDAVFAAASVVARGQERPIVILLSDGMDNASWLEKKGVIDELRGSGINVDFVRVPTRRDEPNDGFGPGRQTPQDVAEGTGGVTYDASDAKLTEKLRARFQQLRQEYVLTYVPRGVKTDDGWHTVKVRVRRPGVKVQARAGYFANAVIKR